MRTVVNATSASVVTTATQAVNRVSVTVAPTTATAPDDVCLVATLPAETTARGNN